MSHDNSNNAIVTTCNCECHQFCLPHLPHGPNPQQHQKSTEGKRLTTSSARAVHTWLQPWVSSSLSTGWSYVSAEIEGLAVPRHHCIFDQFASHHSHVAALMQHSMIRILGLCCCLLLCVPAPAAKSKQMHLACVCQNSFWFSCFYSATDTFQRHSKYTM